MEAAITVSVPAKMTLIEEQKVQLSTLARRDQYAYHRLGRRTVRDGRGTA